MSFNNTERRNVTHQRNTNQTSEKAATATATTVHTDTSSNEVNDIRSSAATTPPSSELPPTQRRKRRRSYHRGRHRKKPVSRTNHQNTVFNLSHRVLSEHEINILSRGLKFVPTPTHVNMTELIADVKSWTRRMGLKEYFWSENTPQLDCNKQYKKPSTWTPSNGRDQVLDCYLSAVGNAILEMPPNRKTVHSNITREERNAIKELKQDNNIVIFEADKGAAVVIQNRGDYLNEAYKQLNGKDQNNEQVYRHLPNDPTKDFQRGVKKAVRVALDAGVIDSDTANYLVVDDAQPANIYFVPKIHKQQRPPPARPICNSIKSATANISKWVDDQLQPLVKRLPSYLKDDNDFLQKIVEKNTN